MTENSLPAPEPLLRCVGRDEMPEDLRPVWDAGMARTGEAKVIEVFANAPHMMKWYFEGFYRDVFYAGIVDRRTKEILRLKLSKQHGCYFCNRFNTVDALEAGLSQEQIDAVLEPDAACWDDKDRAVIALGHQMMLQNMDGELTGPLYDALRNWYSDAELVEIGFVAAVLTGMAKFLFVFDLVTKETVCPVRPRIAAE